MRKRFLYTILILASAGCLYGQGWTFNDGTLNVTSQIWVQSYEFGNTHPSTYNKTPYSDYHSQIKTIILADNITYVGERAFAQCSVAERLVVGKGVKNFAYNAFYFPKSTLKTIEWNAANAGLVDQYNGYMSKYNQGPFGVREVWMEIDDYNYAANAETIIFGPDVVSIPNYFAYFMKNLKKVEFGAKVTSIGIQAFVEITPNTVLIARMPNPASVTLGSGNTWNTSYSPFPASASDRNKITLKVPAEYINQYKAANIWKDFKIEALENSTEDEPSETQTGVLVGEFSVSSTKKVHFSQGNLQYQASTNKWRFALNQYDYIGSANSNISSTYSGWIDLFGYGTSGWNSGFTAYRPYASNSYDGSYIDKDLTGAYANADWGVYNAISNGGNQAGLWRTMTETEWKYLLQERPNADIRLSVGKVNSVSGLILLPDDWVLPEGLTFTPKGSSYDSNKYNTTQWQEMANAGAVFLPAAGWRVIDEVRTTWSSGGIGLRGVYHGSTIADPSASTKKSYAITFYSDKIGGGINARECGLSVRLVQDVTKYVITFVNYDGTPLQTSEMEIGEIPTYTGETPTKPADEQYTYSFIGWDADIVAVTGEATYTAQFEAIELNTTGALSGEFSVSPTKTVHFSKGNLQYQASTKTWRFAKHQWDFVGDANENENISPTYNGWIDLFGWGTGNNPTNTSTSHSDYSVFTDWGINPISNGGNKANLWRTLSKDEWGYLLHERDKAEELFALGSVNNVYGLIILPDNWETPSGLNFTASTSNGLVYQNFHTATYSGMGYESAWYENNNGNNFLDNTYDEAQWKIMESSGAIFLPCSGYRYGIDFGGANEHGCYWSSSIFTEYDANHLWFISHTVNPQDDDRIIAGQAVRLVQDVTKYAITFVNYDGTPLQTSEMEIGEIPTYTGETPTKPADEQYTYSFIGWDADIVAVTGEATYTAQFEAIELNTTGALSGEFSVSPTKTVHFSKGNLQYNAALGTHQCADGNTKQGTWRFAEHQWDYVGDATEGTVYENDVKCNNALISSTYNGWIDLFGWGTSGWDSGAKAYQPWATDTNDKNYYPGNSSTNDLQGSYAYADWGVYNAIKNGGDEAGIWRTLTGPEWSYLFSERTNADQLWGQATIEGHPVLIILPDNWATPHPLTFTATPNNWTENQYTLEEWKVLERHGAICIPSAKRRIYGNTIDEGINGGVIGIWTSSYSITDPINSAWQIAVFETSISFDQTTLGGRHNGHIVRLVQDVTKYAITFVNYDGTPLQTSEMEIGEIPTYTGETPTKPADEQYTYSFIGWDADIVAVTGEATYTAQFESIPVSSSDEIYIHDGEDPDICDIGAHTYTHIIIEPGGKLNIFSSCIHVGVITIISTGIQSGQIHHSSIPVPTDRIFMEYVLNPFGTAASPKLWYAFAVPFEVDIETGITRAYGSQSHISGTDFLIKEYDGMLRATTGKGWRSKLTGTLEPGHLYMIGIDGDCNRWLFEKKSGAAFEGNNHMYISSYIADNSNDNKQNGWNALGNTQLEYTSMNLSGLGIEYLFTYNSRFDKYDIGLVSGASLCVGQPFFIQALADGEFDFIHQSATNNMPALYAQHDAKPLMHFTLTDENHTTGIDNMFITMHDDADGTYTIGRDAARMTTNCTTAAQLWCTTSDGTELSAHGIEMPETETIVPLTLFAPKDGEYLVNMSSRAMNGYAVELLFQGTYLATMFDGQPVTLDLNAGNNSGYALRISRRNMPEGLNDVQGDNVQSTKVIMNDHLYILRAGQVYDAQGKKVK